MRKVVSGMTATLLLACVSCNGNPIYPVSGKVTYNGAPATGAVLSFLRQGGDPSDDPAIMGIVEEDGSFELMCGSLGRGRPPGSTMSSSSGSNLPREAKAVSNMVPTS